MLLSFNTQIKENCINQIIFMMHSDMLNDSVMVERFTHICSSRLHSVLLISYHEFMMKIDIDQYEKQFIYGNANFRQTFL